MNIFGRDNASTTDSSSSTTSWLSGLIEPIVADFIGSNPSIDYIDSMVAGLTPAQQAALDRYGSGAAVDTGTNIAKGGASLIQEQISRIEGLLSGGAKSQFTTGVTGIYNAAGGFINNQNQAIQDQVYADMGNTFGQTAQSNMASTAVSGSSAAQSATNSVLASGANQMTQMMADVSSNVLKGAVGITSGAMGAEMSLINELLGAGGSMAGAGAKMAATGASNQFKAGLFEQWFNQQNINNDRKNTMINSNMEWVDMAALLSVILPTAGIDTTTNSTSTATQNNGGWFSGL
ncbi:Uncharacterised protein [Serratia quinivorans]|uniref:Uncharacterized protein n=1 Tax=Serratia quinivorans TaxID=137545 RepID=A0A380AX51_9GAMM|nr:hypothetical protein [Serratia proteamaculans]RYM60174.1 hypothetical protein BSR03_17170 [Serratia proteamaculans]SUI88134.1 Uncharacterised protein [Serratia quinivorans]